MSTSPVLTISQLKPGLRITQMDIRVIHKWSRPDFKDKKKTDAIELLLLDCEDEIVQATIRKQLISKFGSTISVGDVYTIRNLTVSNNTGLDKATPNPFRLQFEFSSKVEKTNNTSIQLHGYRFAKFEDIINGRVSTTHYIDIVGKLYEIGPIIETRNGHKCRTIKLEDIDGCQISCTLWPPHTLQLPALISEQPNPTQSKIIVIQCVEAKKYEGQWRVQTTYNATVYHVNPDIPEVIAFHGSLSTPARSNSLQIIDVPDNDVDDFLCNNNLKSISDIKLNEKAGTFYTLAKIIDLDCTAGWYYASCRGCFTKAVKNDKGRWMCSKAGCDGNTTGFTSTIPRFQVKFLVIDPTDEVAYFVAFDSLISQYIGPTAADLIRKLEQTGDHESIPIELEKFIDKEFVFKIEIHEKFNVNQGSNSYTVLNMSDDLDMAEKWKSKYNQIFKEECESFDSFANELITRAKNAKVFKGKKISTLSDNGVDTLKDTKLLCNQEEDSISAEATAQITPLKRSLPRDSVESGNNMQKGINIGDACSATKKPVINKMENSS